MTNRDALTRETVILLASSRGDDWFPNFAQPFGFVRIADRGYVSTEEATRLVLVGKLDPVHNLDAIQREDAKRKEPEIASRRAGIEREKREADAMHADRRKAYDKEQERLAVQAKSFANAGPVIGQRKM